MTKLTAQEILDLIKTYQLLVRPSICGGWIVGKFQGIHFKDGAAYCHEFFEAETIEDAMQLFLSSEHFFKIKGSSEQVGYSAIKVTKKPPHLPASLKWPFFR